MSIMFDEILTEPEVIKNAIHANEKKVTDIAAEVKKRKIKNITIIGRGTSDNAGLCFKYFAEILSGIPSGTAHPSVTTMYGANVDYSDHLFVAISQSGRSIDTLAVLSQANKQGALTVAITNDAASPLARAGKYHLDLSAGVEKSIASAKSYIAELTVLYMLAIALSGKPLMPVVYSFPQRVEEAIELLPTIAEAAEQTKDLNNFIILSRGVMQGVGKELQLKLNECAYTFAQFYGTNDFMHGPYALVEEGVNIIILAPSGECSENFRDIATRLQLLNANVLTFSDNQQLLNLATYGVKMPAMDSLSSTIAYSVAMHLFAIELAKQKGKNPDAPRNLKKVTITK
ncbi:MAG: SIS domain-containing protein [Clostridia bacterium]|nr:SIS domain-containing protein [Clostridia bacterium]MBR5987130.1 SIS domain-containing protein [Clostridia bacterium]